MINMEIKKDKATFRAYENAGGAFSIEMFDSLECSSQMDVDTHDIDTMIDAFIRMRISSRWDTLTD